MSFDKREPKLKKIGYWFAQGGTKTGFEFFDLKEEIKDGQIFVHNKGILWKIEV